MAMSPEARAQYDALWVEAFRAQEDALTDEEARWEDEACGALEAETAYERYLEDRGWAAARFDEEMESRWF